MPRFIDISGKRFGRLVVVQYKAGKFEGKKCIRRGKWECLCDCGKTVEVLQTNLKDKRGNRATRSCGCLNSEALALRTGLPGESGLNSLYLQYKYSADSRNLPFEISKAYLAYLTSQPCYYCSIPPNQTKKNRSLNSEYTFNGIDRIDNDLGYSIGNCVSCCSTCNYAKREMTYDQFKSWILKVMRCFEVKGEQNEQSV